MFMKHQWFITLTILLYLPGCSSSNNDISAQKEYMDHVFEIIMEHSIRRDSNDFETLRRHAYRDIKNTESIEDCHTIIKFLLRDLGDHHSRFMPANQVKKWLSISKNGSTSNLTTFRGHLLNEHIGYIQMREFISGDSIVNQAYADSLQQLIKSIDNEQIKGWILDLRENFGGNCWPMLTGIGPLLGSGVCGYFIDNKNHKTPWYYSNGEAGTDSSAITSVSIKPYKILDDTRPVAVLTGPKTASSGEVIATAFRSKSNTRSFGIQTAGLSTANATYMLKDSSMIFLTSAVYADRIGNVFGGNIKPDEKIPFSYKTIGEPGDPPISRAIEWINELN